IQGMLGPLAGLAMPLVRLDSAAIVAAMLGGRAAARTGPPSHGRARRRPIGVTTRIRCSRERALSNSRAGATVKLERAPPRGRPSPSGPPLRRAPRDVAV